MQISNDTHPRGTPDQRVCRHFSLQEVEWEGNTYDAAVLCVDRQIGWMIAQPCQYKGLTAKKCAHLLLDGGGRIAGSHQ